MRQFPSVLIPQLPENAKNYLTALNALSCPTVATSNAISKDLMDSSDILLLPGGGDIEPFLYANENFGSHHIQLGLDCVQLEALDYFVNKRKPILGICKGLQLIQVYFGGSLLQNIGNTVIHQIPEGDCYHNVINEDNTFLYKIYGKQCIVNSSHHQAIISPAPNLCILQKSDDQIVEGLCHKSLPILGIQWHPERICLSHQHIGVADGLLLFIEFLHVFLSLQPEISTDSFSSQIE